MNSVFRKLLLAITIFFVACIAEDDDDLDVGSDTGSDDSNANSPDVEDDPEDEDIWHDTVEFCSVTIEFAFSGDTAFEATLTNYNDATVLISIDNETTGGTVVESCLWPIGTIGNGNGGDEDVAVVNFSSDDTLVITIQIGQGDFFQWTCVGSIDDLLEVFAVCDTREY